jgi:hypothetical protein
LQLAPMLCVASQPTPHAPQLEVEESDVSQPSVSGGALLQSAHPDAQPVYVHVVPLQLAPRLCPEVVSHVCPHAPQLAEADTCVSHPLVSGGAAAQSAHPDAQPVYVHPPPLQAAPVLWVVSHDWAHIAQLRVVLRFVSQPSVFGGALMQSPQPGAQRL